MKMNFKTGSLYPLQEAYHLRHKTKTRQSGKSSSGSQICLGARVTLSWVSPPSTCDFWQVLQVSQHIFPWTGVWKHCSMKTIAACGILAMCHVTGIMLGTSYYRFTV